MTVVVEQQISYRDQIALAVREALSDREDFIPSVVADELLSQLPKGVLQGWLNEMAHTFLVDYIGKISSQMRAVARRTAPSAAFTEALDNVAKASPEDRPVALAALSPFRITFRVDEKNTQRTVGAMTGRDHRFVAGTYRASAKTAEAYATFHTKVAEIVGDRRTDEVFTERQYQEMQDALCRLVS